MIEELLINEVSKKTSLPTKTIRYYEDIGFIPKAKRNNSNYRIYSDEDIKKLTFIKKARSLGFSIDNIREILEIREKGNFPCHTVINLLAEHIEELEKKIAEMKVFKEKLTVTLGDFREHHERGSEGNICGLIENLFVE